MGEGVGLWGAGPGRVNKRRGRAVDASDRWLPDSDLPIPLSPSGTRLACPWRLLTPRRFPKLRLRRLARAGLRRYAFQGVQCG